MVIAERVPRGTRLVLLCLASVLILFLSVVPIKAQDARALQKQLKEITDELRAQSARMTEQNRLLKQQQSAIDAQHDQLTKISAGNAQNSNQNSNPGATSASLTSPVGEAPPKPPQEPPQVVQSLPRGIAVLTPEGHFTFQPSLEYTQTTSNRLVFEGIVIVPGIN